MPDPARFSAELQFLDDASGSKLRTLASAMGRNRHHIRRGIQEQRLRKAVGYLELRSTASGQTFRHPLGCDCTCIAATSALSLAT